MIVQFMLGRLLVFLAGAAPLALTTAARAQDLAAHCAAVGYDDRIKPIPTALVLAAHQALGMGPNEPDTALEAGTVYRCMGGEVWLCNHGANLTCAKGDVRRVSQGAAAWCKDHPGSVVVPMAATGHDTIYTWACVGSEPRVTQAEKLDPRGFIANQWRPLEK